MPPADPEWLTCYRNALANWRYEGFVVFHERAQEWLRVELDGMSAQEAARLLHEFVAGGGQVHQVVETRQIETREEVRSGGYHYDIRIVIGRRRIYFETLLVYEDPDDPDDPLIHVVSVHDA